MLRASLVGIVLACSSTAFVSAQLASCGDGDRAPSVLEFLLGNRFGSASLHAADSDSRAALACDTANYCVATPNSTGFGCSIGATGSTSIATNDFTLVVSHAPALKAGLFWYGPQSGQTPFGDGVACIGGTFFRMNPTVTTDANGDASRHIDFVTDQLPASILPGSTWHFQFWYRDPQAGGAGFNLSDGLRADFCP
ncbi:MAG: hypothetical protein K8S98_15800 [Planctomycetes bacterium]|nr:hypothetical protein [Planctomycetota bacterium]